MQGLGATGKRSLPVVNCKSTCKPKFLASTQSKTAVPLRISHAARRSHWQTALASAT